MFRDTSLVNILGPVILMWVVISVIVHFRSREATALKQATQRFKLATIGTGFTLIVLWFSLPITPVLGTFGYPNNVEVVKSPELLLTYLQDYNKALVRTTEVVHWLIFIFVSWFLTSLYTFSKAIAASAVEQANRNELEDVKSLQSA